MRLLPAGLLLTLVLAAPAPAFTLSGHTCGTVLAGGAGCAITVR